MRAATVCKRKESPKVVYPGTKLYKSGHCRNRTGDLMHAKHARCQLRQTPFLLTTLCLASLFRSQSLVYETKCMRAHAWLLLAGICCACLQALVEAKVDVAGIEPATSCMLSMRATNCAKRPSLLLKSYNNDCFFTQSRRRLTNVVHVLESILVCFRLPRNHVCRTKASVGRRNKYSLLQY
jgi:hypothetical protein